MKYRSSLRVSLSIVLLGVGVSSSARADASITGVCPDGSFFVVKALKDAPCRDPKIVPASELPPIRPEYLPRPYAWYVDQEEQDPNNPYNLVEKAQKIRELRRARTQPQRATGERTQAMSRPLRSATQSMPEPDAPVGALLSLDADAMRDLVALVALSQEAAPAEIVVEDVRRAPQLTLQFAYSQALEAQVRDRLSGRGAGESQARVVAFSVLSESDTEFYPRFFVTQEGKTFRPLAENADEVGLLLGRAGPMSAGLVTLGYLVLPQVFDLGQPLTLWWNDRSVEATLIRTGSR